jgi:hypothetical protein
MNTTDTWLLLATFRNLDLDDPGPPRVLESHWQQQLRSSSSHNYRW